MKLIFKKIISVIVTIGLLAGYSVSVSAENEDTIIFKEDYQGETYTKNIRGNGKLTTDNNGNKYMYIKMVKNADWGATAFTYPIPVISEGEIQIQFDYMTNATSDQSYVLLTNNNYYEAKEWLRLLGAVNGKFNAFSSDGSLVTYTPGKWYTQQVIINMETHDVTANLFEQGGTSPLATLTKKLSPSDSAYSGWPATSTEFVQLRHYGNNDGYIDNIEIKKIYRDPTFIFEENYDGESVAAPNSGNGEVIIDEVTGNKYLKIIPGWTTEMFSYPIPEVSSGKISVEFDYMKDSSKQSYVVLGGSNVYDSKNWLRLLGAMAWGTGSFTALNSSTTLGPITPGQWYTQKLIINMDTREVSLTFYKKGDENPAYEIGPVVLEKTSDGYSDWPETATSFTHFKHFGDVEAYIDNIKISYVYDTPLLSSDDITIETEDGTVQTDFNEVITTAKIFKIDFGTYMKESTINTENIYVTKKDSEDIIPAQIAYEKGLVTLTLKDEPEVGTYTLHVLKDVANLIDVTMSDDFTLDFKTVKNKVKKVVFTDYNGNETEYSDGMVLNPEILKMDIYFSGKVNEEVLDDIKFTSKNDDVNTEKVYNSETNIYTFEFNNYLKQNTEYRIYVPEGITDKIFDKKFTTQNGIYEIISVDFVDEAGNITEDINNISALTANIINTAQIEKNYTLIFDGYHGKILRNHFFKDFVVLPDDAKVTVNMSVDIDEDADTVKKLLWDNENNSENTIKNDLTDIDISSDGIVTFRSVLKSQAEGAIVSLKAYYPDKSESNLLPETENVSVLAADDYVISEENGAYEIQFKIDGETDFYSVVIQSDKGDKEDFVIFYNNKEKAKEIRNQLNNAKDAESFYNIIYNEDDSWRELGFYMPEDEVDKKSVSGLLYNYIDKNKKFDTEDDLAAVKLYRKMYAIELLNENKLKSLTEMENYLDIKSEDFYEFYNKNYLTDSIKEKIYTEIKGGKFATEKDYRNAVLKQIILNTVRYSDGFGNIRDVLTEYEKETGIQTSSLSREDYLKVLGKKYDDYNELEDALKKKSNTGSQGGSSGGSSGGGSSSKSSNINLTVESTLVDTPVAVPVEENVSEFNIFNDLSGFEWAQESIGCLYENGIISGKSTDKFFPHDNITREEFATIIVRAMGIEDIQGEVKFTDVSEDAWYAKYINAAAAQGIIFGKEDGTFGVGENITRQDMAVIIYRAINSEKILSDIQIFEDDELISAYAKEAVYSMREKNIISGFDDGSFKPDAKASRAQAAVMVYRAFFK